MRTPASQWIVLAATVAGITGALWFAGRAVRSHGRTQLLVSDEGALGETPAEPPAHVLAETAHSPQRGVVDRPLDEARCGTRPEEATLTALVQGTDGRRIGGARLAVFACRDGVPLLRDFVEAHGLPDGRACLRTSRNGEVLVAVFAPGFVPSTRRVQSALGMRLALEPFILEPGASIQGTVRIGGQAIARAEVEAVACTDLEVFDADGLPYVWRTDRFVLAKATAETDADGKYRIFGLETGPHSVRLRAIRQPDVAVDVSKSSTVRANAPAENVDFALPGARLRLDFRSSTGPVCCVDAQIEAGDRQFTRSADEAGRLDVIIQPSLAYPITATRRGFKTSRFQLHGLVDGERLTHTVDLDPQTALATLRIDDERSSNVDEATFQFRPRSPLMHGTPFERRIRRDLRAGDFVVADVPAGAWLVTMLSGRALSAPSTMDGHAQLTLHSNCDAEVAVTVPDSGVLTTKVTVIRRGGAEIVVRDASGVRVPALGRLFDARGEEVDAVLIKRDLQAAFGGPPSIHSSDPTFVYPLTCYGTFQLAVQWEGYEPVRVSLTIHPGQILPLEIYPVPK